MTLYVNDREINFTRYPNGEAIVPEFRIEPDEDVEVRLHWTGDHDIAHLALIKGLLDQRFPTKSAVLRAHRGRTSLLIDYMPYSRMDREQEGHCFSLKYIAILINAMEFFKVRVVEPHSKATMDLLARSEPVWATAKLIPTVAQMMNFDEETDFFVLPDAGAAKRYQIPGANMIVLRKKRDFATGKIEGLEVDHRIIPGLRAVSGLERQALIVDDLSSRGGTFVAAADLLRQEFGFRRVNLLVTHMEPAGLLGDLRHRLDRVYCTDTMEFPRPVPANFELIPRSYWL